MFWAAVPAKVRHGDDTAKWISHSRELRPMPLDEQRAPCAGEERIPTEKYGLRQHDAGAISRFGLDFEYRISTLIRSWPPINIKGPLFPHALVVYDAPCCRGVPLVLTSVMCLDDAHGAPFVKRDSVCVL
jgi:hypothetical protein